MNIMYLRIILFVCLFTGIWIEILCAYTLISKIVVADDVFHVVFVVVLCFYFVVFSCYCFCCFYVVFVFMVLFMLFLSLLFFMFLCFS